jgi:prepilin-type N-terminal cleavage/methylation domain-containing protein
MKPNAQRPRAKAQAGFSMVEMLMAALILSIGILGVSLMQVMALKAARGGQSLITAAAVGERVLDQVEMEGRLTWLNATNTDQNVHTPPSNMVYLTANQTYPVTQTFTIKGLTPVASSSDPRDVATFFTVNTTVGNAVTAAGGSGATSLVTVVVSFQDAVKGTNTLVTRSITLNRTVIHG